MGQPTGRGRRTTDRVSGRAADDSPRRTHEGSRNRTSHLGDWSGDRRQRDASAERSRRSDREPPATDPSPVSEHGSSDPGELTERGRRGPRTESETREHGSRENEPQGREWSKHTTGFGEEQTVKVVRNGGGGPKRGWNPATRWTRNGPARAGPGRVHREVDSPDWERQRGDEPHGRDGQHGREGCRTPTWNAGPERGRGPRG